MSKNPEDDFEEKRNAGVRACACPCACVEPVTVIYGCGYGQVYLNNVDVNAPQAAAHTSSACPLLPCPACCLPPPISCLSTRPLNPGKGQYPGSRGQVLFTSACLHSPFRHYSPRISRHQHVSRRCHIMRKLRYKGRCQRSPVKKAGTDLSILTCCSTFRLHSGACHFLGQPGRHSVHYSRHLINRRHPEHVGGWQLLGLKRA